MPPEAVEQESFSSGGALSGVRGFLPQGKTHRPLSFRTAQHPGETQAQGHLSSAGNLMKFEDISLVPPRVGRKDTLATMQKGELKPAEKSPLD